jgi:arginase family enzyme
MTEDAIYERLNLLLRPPGQGIHAVSSGLSDGVSFMKLWMPTFKEAWIEQIKNIPQHSICMFGIPSDAGAGIVKGCAHGTTAVRKSLFAQPVLDLGDIFCIPHYLSDSMLNDKQIEASRLAIYPDCDESVRNSLPVSPLDMAAEMVRLVLALRPDMRFCMIGGDHSVTWPLIKSLVDNSTEKEKIGVLHFDAHTDMLEQRLGVDICFSTWAYHTSQLLHKPDHLLQIGIRATAHPKEYWEQNYGIAQITAKEALQSSAPQLAKHCAQHFSSRGVTKIYISNDIDATDKSMAPSCGTPEAGGLYPHHINSVIDAMIQEGIQVIGMDVVEVAPMIGTTPGIMSTCRNAALYFKNQLKAMQAN